MELPLGWHTDLAVLRLGGASITEHGDHLVVRSPANPSYWWGNFILVTDPAAVSDAPRWLSEFEECFAGAAHRAIGLVAEPDDRAWNDVTMFIERADVLVAGAAVAQQPVADGYTVHLLSTTEDWVQSTRLRQLAFPKQDDFEERVTATRIAVTAGAEVAWFGAFADGVLAAELGIAFCGDGVARYQSVLTHPDHRRRGLTSHLLGVAAAHARARGAETLVIIADTGTDAARLYRAAGFGFDSTSWQVSRVPGVMPEAG